VTRVALWTAVVALVACGDDESLPSMPCDVAELDCQEAVVDRVRSFGLNLEDVPIEVITRAEYGARVGAGAWARDDVEDAFRTDALWLLGFHRVRRDSAAEAEQAVRADAFAAFYDSGTRGISMILGDERDERVEVIVLAHELAHAWQDARYGIRALHRRVTDDDTAIAARAAIEGFADLIGVLMLLEIEGVATSDIDFPRWAEDVMAGLEARVGEREEPYLELRHAFQYGAGLAAAMRDFSRDLDPVAMAARLLDPPWSTTAEVAAAAEGGTHARRGLPMERSVDAELASALDLAHFNSWVLGAWDLALLVHGTAPVRAALRTTATCERAAVSVFLDAAWAPVVVLDARFARVDGAQVYAEWLQRVFGRPSWQEDPDEAGRRARLEVTGRRVTLMLADPEMLDRLR